MISSPAGLSVSVVISTRDRGDRLMEALHPLLDQAAVEIVVVDDGSSDDTIALLERLRKRDRRLKPVAIENRGRPRARLAGVEAATGDVVLVMDDDVIASPGLVEGHAAHHAADPEAVVLGYMPVPPAPQRPGNFPRALYAREYELTVDHWETEPEMILRSFWAGNFSLRRDDYLAMAGDVAAIEHGYHDDLAFGLCCLVHGLHGVFDRELLARHMYERDSSGFTRDAQSSARSLLPILERHEDIFGPVPKDFPMNNLPTPLRFAGTAAARSTLAYRALTGLVWLTGRAHLFHVERRAGGLLWRVEQARALQKARP